MTRGLVARATLIDRMETRLRAESFPRLIVSAVVSVAGGVAFLFSAITLWVGLDSMAVRYGLAALVGYLAFGAGIGLWLGWRRGSLDGAGDAATSLDLDFGSGGGGSSSGGSTFFEGGRSGGGGASGSFIVQPFAQPPPVEAQDGPAPVVPMLGSSASDSSSGLFDADADVRIWLVVLAGALVFGALVAVGYIVYSAPILLTEVALDAGVMSGVYRSVRRQDAGHWLGSFWRRTWLPALAVIVCMSVAGYLLQLAVPDARSIGGVIWALQG